MHARYSGDGLKGLAKEKAPGRKTRRILFNFRRLCAGQHYRRLHRPRLHPDKAIALPHKDRAPGA
jgi:hypothetical protein